MQCLNKNCNANDLEKDDNFCYKCGMWTTKGYSYFSDKKNIEKMINGETIKQNNKLSIMLSLFLTLIIVFTTILLIRGDYLFKPFFYLKKQCFNYFYGYKTSLIKTDNKYTKENILSYEDAVEIIKNDIENQYLYCFNTKDVKLLTTNISEEYSIPSVSFCDMKLEEAQKIKDVIDKMYELFPNIKGSLTNITITNAKTNDEYISRFQSMYQFVNSNEDILNYNKVNKTQILLNSYYFLNENILDNPIENVVGTSWYVKGATWESTIAHEFGHYISFKLLLKKYNLDNITLVTSSNELLINSIVNEYDNGNYSLLIVNEAIDNYNKKYNENISLKEFASLISNYASTTDESDKILTEETIAEAVHDYYLHENNCSKASYEIITIIKSKLQENI